MPKAGKVVVSISPFDARFVAAWLRALPPPLWGVPRSNTPVLENGVRVELVDMFEAIANRKRQASGMSRVGIELDREDALRFAAKVSGGMLFGGGRAKLPAPAHEFCIGCMAALRKKRGRRQLHGDVLKLTSTREHLDLRHRKRLKARERVEKADRDFWADRQGLGAAFFGTDTQPKKSP